MVFFARDVKIPPWLFEHDGDEVEIAKVHTLPGGSERSNVLCHDSHEIKNR